MLDCQKAEMGKMTPGQRRALWGWVRRLCISEDDFRGWVSDRVGKRSIRELSAAEASRLIDEIAWKWKEGVPVWVPNRITSAQARRIALLGADIGWDERRALGLARRMYGVEAMDRMSRSEASGLIEALKAIAGRKIQTRAA